MKSDFSIRSAMNGARRQASIHHVEAWPETKSSRRERKTIHRQAKGEVRALNAASLEVPRVRKITMLWCVAIVIVALFAIIVVGP